MSIVPEGYPCELCGKPLINSEEPLFNFTHLGLENPNYNFLDDSACHVKCLEEFEYLEDFLKEWNEKAKKGLGHQWMLQKDDDGSLSFMKETLIEESSRLIWLPVVVLMIIALFLALPFLWLLELLRNIKENLTRKILRAANRRR